MKSKIIIVTLGPIQQLATTLASLLTQADWIENLQNLKGGKNP